MTIPASGTDYPPLSIGALGHPSAFVWPFIERSRGQYTFAGFDTYVNDAKAHGLVEPSGAVDVTITLGLTPGWAAANQSTCRNQFGVVQCTGPPANIQDWKDFITTLINHYNGVSAPHVKYYELWNETNAPNFWTGTYQDMVNLAAAAYPIVHQDPYSQLLTPSVTGPVLGSLPNNAVTWMSSYLQAGGSHYADGGTFHGYIARSETPPISPYPAPEQDSTAGCVVGSTCYGSIITKETAMRQVFDQNGLAGKPMLDTEGSWGLTSNITDPDMQAAWLARWLILQASFYPSVTQVSWYTWGFTPNPSSIYGDIESTPGVPSEAGAAYGQVRQWIVGSMFTSACAAGSSGTWTCGLTLAGSRPAQIVWNVNGPTNYTPASTFTQYQDLAGTTTKITGAVPIGTKPLLLT